MLGVINLMTVYTLTLVHLRRLTMNVGSVQICAGSHPYIMSHMDTNVIIQNSE